MSAYVSAELRRQVPEHFAESCAYCRTPVDLTSATFEVEHIIPRAAGGETTFTNLCLACPTCNRYKQDRTSAVDPDIGETVRLFHPHLDDWGDHFRWSEDATQVVALSSIGRATAELLRMNRPQMLRVRRIWASVGEHPRAFD